MAKPSVTKESAFRASIFAAPLNSSGTPHELGESGRASDFAESGTE